MRKLMTGDIRRGSKSRMRRWRKFTCGGTTSTVSGTMKSRPTLVLLFLNTAQAAGGCYPVLTVSRFEQVINAARRKPLLRAVIGEALAIETGKPLLRAEPQIASRIQDDFVDSIAGESVGRGVDLDRQLTARRSRSRDCAGDDESGNETHVTLAPGRQIALVLYYDHMREARDIPFSRNQ